MIFGLALAADKVAIKMSMPIFLLFYDSNANHKFSTDGSVRGARESEGCAGMPSADSLQRHPDLLQAVPYSLQSRPDLLDDPTSILPIPSDSAAPAS